MQRMANSPRLHFDLVDHLAFLLSPVMRPPHTEFTIAGIALAWAFAGILHLLTFSWILPDSWGGAFYLFATLFLLLKPASLARFASFLAATALVLFRNYEVLANHVVLEFWITISLLAASLAKLPQLRRQHDPLSLFSQLAPLVRVPYLLLFGFAIFSKLNSDFLDPASSCASVFATRILETYHLDALTFGVLSPEQTWIGFAAIYLTLAFEIAIPCLLIFQRTRATGIAVALVFHFLMGLVPILGISSFSSLSFALLLFFFPQSALLALHQNLHKTARLLGSSPRRRRISKATIILAILLTIVIQHRYFHPSALFANCIWAALSLPLLWILFAALRKRSAEKPGALSISSFLIPKPRILALLNLPALLLGILPYFALQTQGSFTMFSNLRLLGDRPNHFLANPTPSPNTPKLVKILGTNHPALSAYPDSNTLITDHELRRKVGHTENDFYILCEYDGDVSLIGRFEGKLTPHPLLEPNSHFLSRFIRFRDVSTNERCECAW